VGKKIGSFGFFAFGLWVGKNQMCLFARWLFQHGIQRFAYMIRGGLRGTFLSKSTKVDAGENVDYPHRNRP
jgi:hypothetical protein